MSNKEYQRQWYLRNRSRRLKAAEDRRRQLLYSMSATEYDQLLNQQNYRCAVCGKPTTEQTNRLSIDHCHNTGRVRGLLCIKCNSGIGMLQDSPELLFMAMIYLQAS